MKCSNGHNNESKSVYCEICGESLNTSTSTKTKNSGKGGRRKNLLIFIPIILGVFFGLWFYFLKPIPVPNLTNVSLAQAESSIKDSNFKVGKKTQDFSDNIPAGNIISHSPGADKSLRRNSTIDLVISKGPVLKDITFNLTVIGFNYTFFSDGNCRTGLTGYWDIRDGATVTLRDESGNPIGQGSLDSAGFSRFCIYTAVMRNIPSNKISYSFEVGIRNPLVYSKQELASMDWEISASLS